MASRNAQGMVNAGLSPTMNAASGGGDTVDTGDTVFLIVTSGATTTNLTITTIAGAYGALIPNVVVAIPANAGASAPPVCIPLPAGEYANAVTGQAALAWSATTNILFGVVRR